MPRRVKVGAWERGQRMSWRREEMMDDWPPMEEKESGDRGRYKERRAEGRMEGRERVRSDSDSVRDGCDGALGSDES